MNLDKFTLHLYSIGNDKKYFKKVEIQTKLSQIGLQLPSIRGARQDRRSF